jgi:phosphoserine aminotransferase
MLKSIGRRRLVYDALDEAAALSDTALPCRSLMNVTFRLPSDDVEKRFLAEAAQQKLCELKGHRSVGGIRASIYNAMPMEGARLLAEFMREFARRNG